MMSKTIISVCLLGHASVVRVSTMDTSSALSLLYGIALATRLICGQDRHSQLDDLRAAIRAGALLRLLLIHGILSPAIQQKG